MTSPYREVIVGTDGSPTARLAVVAAASLARACQVPLAVATAWYRHLHEVPSLPELAAYGPATPASHEASWASETVAEAAGTARSMGVDDVRVFTPTGNAADALVRLAEQRPASLLVVGTVGLKDPAERLLGNVPHQLTHHAPRDVFLVARRPDGEAVWKRVLLATDGSPTAGIAVAHGYALAQALGATAVLATVARSEPAGAAVLDRAADGLGDPAIERAVATVHGDVSRTLIEMAADFDLLVLGNKGMSGPSRLLGSVSNRVTHEVPTDLLLVNTTR